MSDNLYENKDYADVVNTQAKDSVFVDLFHRPQYLIQLYRVLHPEDQFIDEDDLTIVTLNQIMFRNRYNDLGFMARDRLIILVEAQSTWSINILIRFLIYLGDTYSKHIRKHKQNIYGSAKLRLPAPEFYVIYTGDEKDTPEVISIKRDYFGDDSAVDLTARVIRSSIPGDIINQFIQFSKIFDEQIRIHGYTDKAVGETLRICSECDVLKEYLKGEEAKTAMFGEISDKEKAWIHELERQEDYDKGHEEGQEGILNVIKYLHDSGRDNEIIRLTVDEEFRNQVLAEIADA